MTNPPDIRFGSESDHKPDSEVGSNERTNERTDASDPNGRRSGAGSRRERAYATTTPPSPIISPAADHAIAEARALMASKRANLCRHGVATCHDCERAKSRLTQEPA